MIRLFLSELFKWYLCFLAVFFFVSLFRGRVSLTQEYWEQFLTQEYWEQLLAIPLIMTIVFCLIPGSYVDFVLSKKCILGPLWFMRALVLFLVLILILVSFFSGGVTWRVVIISIIPIIAGLLSCWKLVSRISDVISRVLFDA